METVHEIILKPGLIRVANSTWTRIHPEFEKEKSVHDFIADITSERGRLPTTDELHSGMNEVRGERNEKSCSQSSPLRSSLRWRNKPHRWPRQLKFADILHYLFYGEQRPLKNAIEDVAGGGEAGVLEFLHHVTQPNAPMTT